VIVAYLQYYVDEHKRHPTLHATGIIFEDAQEVISRLAKEHEVTIKGVEKTSGNRSSHYNPTWRRIRLNTDQLNWLLVLHEFAHALDQKLRRDVIPTANWHTKAHAELVNCLARAVVERGWVEGIPAERAARDLARLERSRARAAHAADPAVTRAKKIEKRRAQVAGLEHAILRCMIREKALNTRLKRARKSLAALERAAAKKGD
jgi:hypothetical protein